MIGKECLTSLYKDKYYKQYYNGKNQIKPYSFSFIILANEQNKFNINYRDVELDLSRNDKFVLYKLCEACSLEVHEEMSKKEILTKLRSMSNKPIEFF